MRKKDSGIIKFLPNKIIYAFMVIISVVLILVLIYHKPLPVYEEKTIDLSGNYIKVYVAGEKVSSGSLVNIAEKEFQRLYKKFSANAEGSTVSELNKLGAIQADEETIFLFQSAINIAKITGDSYDPTLRPLIEAWGFNDKKAHKQVPEQSLIDGLLPLVSYKFIKIDSKENKVKLSKPGVKVDLQGIENGFIIDRVIDRILEVDPKATGLITTNEIIGVIGPKYGNRPWPIGIRDPYSADETQAIKTIYLYKGAFSTSASYQNYFEQDGKIYHSILDPKNGYPAGQAVSVSVVADKCMIAEAFSTGLFVLGYKNPALESFTKSGIQSFIIAPTRETTQTSGFQYYEKKER